MLKFRKKPVGIKTKQIKGDIAALRDFTGDAITDWDAFGVSLETPEGVIRGNAGD